MSIGIAGRSGNSEYQNQVLTAPPQPRGSFCTFLPEVNETTGTRYSQVECSCGTRHTRTVQFNNFECSSCGRLYIWGTERTGGETFPRS